MQSSLKSQKWNTGQGKIRGMPAIPGFYVFDDDNLSPGKSKDGGFHHNLYEDGKLTGHARFIPSEDILSEGFVTENVYVQSDDRRRGSEFDGLLDSLLESLVNGLVEAATPHVERWWAETAWPFVSKQGYKAWSKLRRRKQQSPATDAVKIEPVEPVEGNNIEAVTATKMSASEAKARMLAAAAAKAFSEEQLQMVMQSDIVGADGVDEIREQLAKIPRDELIGFVEQLVRNPSGLEEGNLANLAGILAARQKSIEPRKP